MNESGRSKCFLSLFTCEIAPNFEKGRSEEIQGARMDDNLRKGPTEV